MWDDSAAAMKWSKWETVERQNYPLDLHHCLECPTVSIHVYLWHSDARKKKKHRRKHRHTCTHTALEINKIRQEWYLSAHKRTQFNPNRPGILQFYLLHLLFPILVFWGNINDAWERKCHPQNKENAISPSKIDILNFFLCVHSFTVVKCHLL